MYFVSYFFPFITVIFIIVTMTNLLQSSCIMLNKILSSEFCSNESSHRFTFSSVLFCYTYIHAFQARVVEYYVSCNNYTLQPQDNIYNMNRYQEHSVTAINWMSNLKSKTLIYIVIECKSYYNIAYNIIVLMCNCIFINDGLLIAAHYKQLFSKYVTYFISHCHITYIRLYSTVILCIVKKLYNMFTHR